MSTTPCPPSYSPASQRSRYSQPNLPTLMISTDRRSSGSPDRRTRMSQPTLNSSFSGINFAGMNRGSRLSYTSLRATSGDNSINEERLSAPSVQGFGGSSRGSLTMDQMSSRHDVPGKRERLSQPTLVTSDYHPGRGVQRLSHPCLSSGKEPPLPPMIKHKRFSPAIHVSQRDRRSQLDIGAKYRNLKESAASKVNRERFSIPELKTQNDLSLIVGTPKQRFSLDSQLTRNPDTTRSILLPIASSPISEHQQTKIEELTGIPGGKLKTPTREGLGSVLLASTTPILPPGERQFLSPDFGIGKKTITAASTTSTQQKSPPPSVLNKITSVTPIPTRERMSVPEIRNSSLRRLLDPPTRQRHSITGNLRQSIITPIKPLDLGKKSPNCKYLFEEALERFKKDEREENRKNETFNEERHTHRVDEPKHIQRHYSYTYESTDVGSSILGKISVPKVPKKKYLESNFDENEQVITTVIETDVPMITASHKYVKKYSYSTDTPKWIKKYLENESPKVGRKTIVNKEKANRRNSRRKNSLESLNCEKIIDKVRSKSVCSSERNTTSKSTVAQQPEQKKMKNTFVRIVPSSNAQESKYEVGVETNWTDTDIHGLYGDECEDTDSDDSTSI